MSYLLNFILLFVLVLASGTALVADEAKPEPAPKKSVANVEAKKAPAKAKKNEEAPTGAKAEPAGGKEVVQAKGEEKSVDSVVVKKEPIEVTVKVNGMLGSTRSTPIALNLLRWSDLLVVETVPHGTEVKKGDVLVKLDTRAILKEIENLESGMPLRRLELETAEMNLAKLKKSTPMTLEKARKEKMQAEEDFAYFEDVTRPMREKSAVQNVKQVKEYLAYAEEELNQLKKMYEADDLTEETEEIILRRAQNSVNDYRWMLEQAEERSRRNLDTFIPREHEGLRRSLQEKQLAWRMSEKSIPDALKKAELEFQGKVRSLREAEKSLEEHRKDLESMKVTAPHDGIVYYGMSQRGKWTTASTVERKLIPGGKLSMREIFMTVADPAKQELVLSIPENKLTDLAVGQTGEVKLTSDPDAEIVGKITSVSRVPYSDNTFGGIMQLTRIDKEAVLSPGMKAEAEVKVYERKEALLVPLKSITNEDEKEFVTLKGGAKRRIERGRSADGKVEVLKGLKVGDEVLAAPAVDREEDEKSDSSEEKK